MIKYVLIQRKPVKQLRLYSIFEILLRNFEENFCPKEPKLERIQNGNSGSAGVNRI